MGYDYWFFVSHICGGVTNGIRSKHSIFKHGILANYLTAGPILGVALGVGLFIGLIQAATSINEMTLSFVPKLFVVLFAMTLMSTLIMTQMTDYFKFIFEEIARKGL